MCHPLTTCTDGNFLSQFAVTQRSGGAIGSVGSSAWILRQSASPAQREGCVSDSIVVVVVGGGGGGGVGVVGVVGVWSAARRE